MTGKSLVQKEKGKDRQKRKRKSWKVIQADLRLRKRKGNQWKAHREIHAWPTVEWLMRCAGFMFVHASVSDWLWMFNGNPWAAGGNPSCSFNCTDLRKSYRLLFLYARVNVYAHPPCVRVFARGLMRSADLCCFHGDWFPSSVRGLNHRQRALSFPATWLRFIFQFHFHQLLPPVFSFFYFQTMTESVWSVKLERASVNNGV